jgi:hypothetical protein
VTVFAFDEGQGLSEHTAPFDALVYVLEGSADDPFLNASTNRRKSNPARFPWATEAQLSAVL